jgi:O-6-methylguanine DNA methyltransferase
MQDSPSWVCRIACPVSGNPVKKSSSARMKILKTMYSVATEARTAAQGDYRMSILSTHMPADVLLQRHNNTRNIEDIYYAIDRCFLGHLLIATSSAGLCAVLFGDTPDTLRQEVQRRFAHLHAHNSPAGVQGHLTAVLDLLATPHQNTMPVPLDIQGTPFQQRVWQELCTIPAGQTASYGDIAARIGKPGGARAVGQACGANSLAVVIPCHRILARDGSAGGYRWGLARKRALLEHEGIKPEGRMPCRNYS